mmetsp:Transcript_23156/g.64715  ORF Transcript_23156/g.64715 Transcript_23156/m.64715 type:complete len:239 (+) Transcript_23156:68-784(+)
MSGTPSRAERQLVARYHTLLKAALRDDKRPNQAARRPISCHRVRHRLADKLQRLCLRHVRSVIAVAKPLNVAGTAPVDGHRDRDLGAAQWNREDLTAPLLIVPCDDEPGHKIILVLVSDHFEKIRGRVHRRQLAEFHGVHAEVVLHEASKRLRVRGAATSAHKNVVVYLRDLPRSSVGDVVPSRRPAVGTHDHAIRVHHCHDGRASGNPFLRGHDVVSSVRAPWLDVLNEVLRRWLER